MTGAQFFPGEMEGDHAQETHFTYVNARLELACSCGSWRLEFPRRL